MIAELVSCAQCGASFTPHKPTQRFCSRVCFYGWWTATVQRRAAARGIQRLVERHADTVAATREPTVAWEPVDEEDTSDDLAWAERSQYWENVGAPKAPMPLPGRRRVEPTPLVLTGHGVRLRVDHGALLVQDGFTHHPQATRTWRLFPGDRRLPSRIVLLDSDGSISLDVLTWLAQQQVSLVVLNWRGEVVSVVGGQTTAPETRLREAQLAARRNDLGLKLAIRLVRDKVANSQATLRTFPLTPGRELTRSKLDRILEELRRTPPENVEGVRLVEARAALAYCGCWQSLPLRWKGTGRHPIPPEWHRMGIRQSLLGASNRNATHPVNAMLNYAYGVLESQVRVATMAAGLDATIGYLHACRPGRVALVYDLMEPLRPQVDRLVLDFVRSHTVAPSDVILTQTGTCRLHPQLARTVAGMTVGEQPVRDVTAGAVAALGRAVAS